MCDHCKEAFATVREEQRHVAKSDLLHEAWEAGELEASRRFHPVSTKSVSETGIFAYSSDFPTDSAFSCVKNVERKARERELAKLTSVKKLSCGMPNPMRDKNERMHWGEGGWRRKDTCDQSLSRRLVAEVYNL